jgi:serine/threonine-protein kinase RsbW
MSKHRRNREGAHRPMEARIVLPPDLGSLPLLGRELIRFAAAALGRTGESKDVHDLRLAVQEAVANLLKHEGERPAMEGILVELHGRLGVLEVKIHSRGRPFDPTAGPALLKAPEHLAENGRGLFLIQALADEVRYEFEEGENILTMVKYIQAGEDAA